jgi:hypothetical protein
MKYPVSDCIINEFYTDAKQPLKARQRYCEKVCDFKCKKGLLYKKLQTKS